MTFRCGSGCGSGSCYFRHWPSRRQQKTNLKKSFWRYIYIIFQKTKSPKKSQTVRIKVFLTILLDNSRMIEGSGSGRPKNMWIRWIRIRIRIRNTALGSLFLIFYFCCRRTRLPRRCCWTCWWRTGTSLVTSIPWRNISSWSRDVDVVITGILILCHALLLSFFALKYSGRDLAEWLEERLHCQCQSRNSPGFDPSILRHSGIWGAADEIMKQCWNKYKKYSSDLYTVPYTQGLAFSWA